MTKYILSVDGGGMRGIIPAVVLAEIEKRARKPITQLFDMLVGTSTGAIVASALCKKDDQGKSQYSAKNVVNFFIEEGPRIFKTTMMRKSVICYLNGAVYPSDNMEAVLYKYFGEDKLTDVSNNLLITSYDIKHECPFLFKSWKGDRNFIKIKDALIAATAAPTFFTPKCMQIEEKERVLIDGAVFANNPAACAYAGAKSLFPKERVVLLSLGTGRPFRSIEYCRSKKLGKIAWMKPLLQVMVASSIDAVNYQMDKLMDDKYVRIQSQLQIASPQVDNSTSQNLKHLQQEANVMIEHNQGIIDEFCLLDERRNDSELFSHLQKASASSQHSGGHL